MLRTTRNIFPGEELLCRYNHNMESAMGIKWNDEKQPTYFQRNSEQYVSCSNCQICFFNLEAAFKVSNRNATYIKDTFSTELATVVRTFDLERGAKALNLDLWRNRFYAAFVDKAFPMTRRLFTIERVMEN